MPVAANATVFPTYTIQVNDTTPIWAYCRQTSHCGDGMVFSANAVETGPNNFEAFQARAEQINGTSSSSNSTSSTSGNGNGAGAIRLSGTGIVVGLVAAVIGLAL